MDKATLISRIRNVSPIWIIAVWPAIHLVSFLPSIPQPTWTIGYLWKAELALAGILFFTLVASLVRRSKKIEFQAISRSEFSWVVLPLLLFAAWSGLSVFWAQSIHNAIHHTLLWSCFLIFYFFARQIVAKPKLESTTLIICAVVFAIIALSAIVIYVGSVKPLTVIFRIRYSKYAEAFTLFIPVFAALSLVAKNRQSVFYAVVAIVTWLAVNLSLSRTALISGTAGVIIFFGFAMLAKSFRHRRGRLLGLIASFLAVAVLTQTSAWSGTSSTIDRLTGDDFLDQSSVEVRLIYWGVAIESFKQHPVLGVGADNYQTNYRNALEGYASANPDNKTLTYSEDILPERAHNEYLQILSELGLVGIGLFVWLHIGILLFLWKAWFRGNWTLMTIGAVSGLVAFFLSSMASSYSFRVTANGLCFFFLLAIIVKTSINGTKNGNENSEPPKHSIKIKSFTVVIAAIICVAMIGFSALRAVSLLLLAKGLESQDRAVATRYIERSIFFGSGRRSFEFLLRHQALWSRQNKGERIPFPVCHR